MTAIVKYLFSKEKLQSSLFQLLSINNKPKEDTSANEILDTNNGTEGISIYTYAKDTVLYPRFFKNETYDYEKYFNTALAIESVIKPSIIMIIIEKREKATTTISYNLTKSIKELFEKDLIDIWTKQMKEENNKKYKSTIKIVLIHEKDLQLKEAKTKIETLNLTAINNNIFTLEKSNFETLKQKYVTENEDYTDSEYWEEKKKWMLEVEIYNNLNIIDNSGSALHPISYISKIVYYALYGKTSPHGELTQKLKIIRNSELSKEPEITSIIIETQTKTYEK